MNDNTQPETLPAEVLSPATVSATPSIAMDDDDSDLANVSLGTRQEDAIKPIECAGGCT